MFSKTLLALVLLSASASAQYLNHRVMSASADANALPRPYSSAVDTIDVLAVLVQFQIDSDNRTNGNGQFDLSTPSATGLDAPPHNRQYFQDHLTFLANYYSRVSKGKTLIRSTLIDTVYTLAGQMSAYSPPKTGPNILVGDLARDTWQRVDASGKVADFSRYDCFVVFHAGVGRDIDIVGTVGYDPTPLDIPSLYLGLNAFKSFYGAAYEGIPVRNGFKITNTIVMPETETRELPATPSNVLLRLGINGLLCASVGNFLGLPDLFDTNTGRSGIGRFGLMDGQAIFSFAGAFPPEPSAWEKYWLGWIQPITVPTGTSDLGIPAASVDSARVYRIPISGSEYYLVENRNRDWARNGQRITSSYGGTIRQQTFLRDTTGFQSFDVAQLSGNVIDVDDFDWSVPGGVGSNGTFFDGGVLIWHIDETIIAQGLITNGVNANPERRGVDVEEADGSQDIGQQYGQLEAGSGSEEGTALDFWYVGNGSPINRNEFSATSFPNSASNAGANSHITIKEFSARGAFMTLKVILGDNVALLAGFPKQIGLQAASPSLTVANSGSPASVSLIVTTTRDASIRPTRSQSVPQVPDANVYAWRLDGSPVLAHELFAGSAGSSFVGSPAIADINNDGFGDVLVADAAVNGRLQIFQSRPGVDSLALLLSTRQFSKRLTTSPLVTDSLIVVGASRATVYMIWRSSNRLDSMSIAADTSDVTGLATHDNRFAILFTTAYGRVGSNLVTVSFDGPTGSTTSTELGVGLLAPIVGSIGNGRISVIASRNGRISGLGTSQIDTRAPILNPPALADVDGDGIRDIIVFAGNKIHVYNYAGASLDNFPKLVASSKPITSNPVIADVDCDGDVDIVAVTEDGFVVAYDKNGTMASGFPLQAGRGNQSVAAFAFPGRPLSATNAGLAIASSEDGTVTAWETGAVGGNQRPKMPWPQYQHDAQHTGLAVEPISGSPLSNAFFPKERAYNWPNPVYNGTTYIRYFVSENATVKVKVFDLAGDLVTEFNGPGVGGVDNEVAWNVADVQSGIYLARIEAIGTGRSETAIVKVAVVK